MKYLLKQAAIIGGLEAISRLRADRLFPRSGGRGLIFTMHHVRPKQPRHFDPNAHLEITPDYLEDVLAVVKQQGLVPVSLDELPAKLAETDDRRRFVCFTLDDGYRNNAVHAAPIFRRHKVPYTIFVTPGFIDRSATLWWETAADLIGKLDSIRIPSVAGDQLMRIATLREKRQVFRRLCEAFAKKPEHEVVLELNALAAEAGIDARRIVDVELMDAGELRALADDPLVGFGGHTMTHRNLARLPIDEMKQEIRNSMAAVATLTGRKISTFAYPYGTACSAGEREFQAASEAGLNLAVTTRPGMLTNETLQRVMAVPRVSLNGLYQKKHYIPALVSGLPFQLKSLA